jgi:hypothetical protein
LLQCGGNTADEPPRSDAGGTAGTTGGTGASGAGGTTGESGSGGTAGSAGDGGESGEGGRAPVALAFDDGFVKKVSAATGRTLLVLLERPLDFRVEFGFPRRELRWLTFDGELLARVGSSDERALVDFAEHPSGNVSLLFASVQGYTLVRHDADGSFVAETSIEDPEVDRDPPALVPGAPTGPIGPHTVDTGKVVAVGDELAAATRTGRHSVVAYRFQASNEGFSQTRRTLVVPAHAISPVGLTGGSYDTFGQLESQYTVYLAVDARGTTYVAVQHPLAGGNVHLRAHEQVFGERLVGDPDAADLYVTRIDRDGRRVGTSVVGTPLIDELYGMSAGDDSAFVIGRTEHWNESGTGFDAIVASVHGDSGATEVIELDVVRSDVAFDAAALAGGAPFVAGASDYVQNPHGASVSEESGGFVARGAERFALARGPRHNEARTLYALAENTLLVGGMRNGPGTHSGDADASLVRAEGFLVELDAVRE